MSQEVKAMINAEIRTMLKTYKDFSVRHHLLPWLRSNEEVQVLLRAEADSTGLPLELPSLIIDDQLSFSLSHSNASPVSSLSSPLSTDVSSVLPVAVSSTRCATPLAVLGSSLDIAIPHLAPVVDMDVDIDGIESPISNSRFLSHLLEPTPIASSPSVTALQFASSASVSPSASTINHLRRSICVTYDMALSFMRLGGFVHDPTKDGDVVDGHDLPAQIARRKVFLERLHELTPRVLFSMPSSEQIAAYALLPYDQGPIILVNQDESSFHSNDKSYTGWSDSKQKGTNRFKKKSDGAAIMVSMFICSMTGAPLFWGGESSFHTFQSGGDVWWTGEKMQAETERVVALYHCAYPWARFVFMFDFSSNHSAKPSGMPNWRSCFWFSVSFFVFPHCYFMFLLSLIFCGFVR